MIYRIRRLVPKFKRIRKQLEKDLVRKDVVRQLLIIISIDIKPIFVAHAIKTISPFP